MICAPISLADRGIIDAFIAKKKAKGETVIVPLGVSSWEVQEKTSHRGWTGKRNCQSKAARAAASKLRKNYRRLVDDGKSGQEIAKIIGVKIPAVYMAVRRMGLKLRRSRV